MMTDGVKSTLGSPALTPCIGGREVLEYEREKKKTHKAEGGRRDENRERQAVKDHAINFDRAHRHVEI
jgi:hypothetical protein